MPVIFLGGQKKSPRPLTSQKAKAENLLPRYHFFWRRKPPSQPGPITRSPPVTLGLRPGLLGRGSRPLGRPLGSQFTRQGVCRFPPAAALWEDPFSLLLFSVNVFGVFVVRYDTKWRPGLSRGNFTPPPVPQRPPGAPRRCSNPPSGRPDGSRGGGCPPGRWR